MACRVLLLGFTGFREYQWNPAEEVAVRLDGSTVSGCTVNSRVVPVSLKTVRGLVPRLLGEAKPDMALGVGLAPSARSVLLELAAANHAFFDVGDEDGYRAGGEEVLPGGPPVAHTTIPVARVLRECRAARGLPLRPSVSIGTYLCGALGYTLMRWGMEEGRPAGFLHIPPDTGLAMKLGLPNHLSLRDTIDTVRCVIEATMS